MIEGTRERINRWRRDRDTYIEDRNGNDKLWVFTREDNLSDIIYDHMYQRVHPETDGIIVKRYACKTDIAWKWVAYRDGKSIWSHIDDNPNWRWAEPLERLHIKTIPNTPLHEVYETISIMGKMRIYRDGRSIIIRCSDGANGGPRRYYGQHEDNFYVGIESEVPYGESKYASDFFDIIKSKINIEREWGGHASILKSEIPNIKALSKRLKEEDNED